MADAKISIGGMSCQHCVGAVKKALDGLNGVQSSEVEVGSASVSFDASAISQSDIEAAIVKAGYTIN